MKKIIIGILLAASLLIADCKTFFLALETPVRLFDADKAEEVVQQFVETADKEDWNSFINCMSNDRKEYYSSYFSNDDMHEGIKQVRSIRLRSIYRVSENEAKKEWLIEEYPILAVCNEIYTFVLETDCEVLVENQFFYNGINYFIIVIAVEEGELKVVQFNRPSTELLSEIVVPEISEDDEDYDAEIAGINVIKTAESGRIVNASQEELTEGFEIVQVEQKFGVTTLATDPPMLSHYATYHYPTKIKVLLNKTGANKTEVVEVGIVDYLKNVLPNEWMPLWKEEALLAGAYCVKMVAIYRTLKPMDSAGGYHLSQKTQNYIPGSDLYESTSEAIEAIYNCGMSDTYGILFFPMYGAGEAGQAGAQGSGHVKQYGTQYLARQGYTYQQILNYYYSGTDYSVGDLKFFSYNIGF